MPELAYVNGSIMPIEEAVVPIEDRGYQFGDAVYEVITSLNGRPFMLDAHLARLERSMTELSFPHFDMGQIRAAVLKLFPRVRWTDADYTSRFRAASPPASMRSRHPRRCSLS